MILGTDYKCNAFRQRQRRGGGGGGGGGGGLAFYFVKRAFSWRWTPPSFSEIKIGSYHMHFGPGRPHCVCEKLRFCTTNICIPKIKKQAERRPGVSHSIVTHVVGLRDRDLLPLSLARAR